MWILELMVIVEQPTRCRDHMSIVKTPLTFLMSIRKYQLNSLHKLSYLIPPTTLGSQSIISYLCPNVFRLAKRSFT